MATTVADRVFIDTNVLVYASRPTVPEHVAARAALARLEASGCEAWISRQVLREYLAVVTRPQATAPSLPMATAIADVRRFQSLFEVADEDPAELNDCSTSSLIILVPANRCTTPTWLLPCSCTAFAAC